MEIEYQLQDLQKQDLPRPDRNCLFVGSGDSYVAGLAAQYVSAGRALCYHPTDVISNPSIVNGRNVHVVSISGNTKANILAARTAKRNGARTTAITAKQTSRLAKECDRVIELKCRSAGVATPGTISFTFSMLACASLATKISLPMDLARIYKEAKGHAEKAVKKISKDTCFILGDRILYSTAIYGTLKFNEVFGTKAIAYPAEEFCHAPLFSLKKNDNVIIMGNAELDKRLRSEGFSSVHANFNGEGIGLLMQSIFFMQFWVLKLAQKRRLTSCYFLKNKRLLKMSSDFIY